MSKTDRNGFKIWEKVCASRLLETDAVEDTKKLQCPCRNILPSPFLEAELEY